MDSATGEWTLADIPEGCVFVECCEAWSILLDSGEVVEFDQLAILSGGILIRCKYHEKSNTIFYSKY